MCTIPLDHERRFEQRWAARFSDALQEHREKQRQHLTAPDESKEKPTGLSWPLGPPACERTRDSQDSEIAGAAHSATLEPHAR
jgi:hypothetical protein